MSREGILVYLVRHGECGFSGRYLGRRSDPPLDDRGQEQVRALASWAEGLPVPERPEILVTSPLLRARQTILPLAAVLGLPAREEPLFREMDFGLWDGLSWEEIRERWPREARLWGENPQKWAPPEGQTGEDFSRETDRGWDLLTGASRNCLLVTHGGVIRRILARLLELPPGGEWRLRADRGSVTVLSCSGGYWVLEALNRKP